MKTAKNNNLVYGYLTEQFWCCPYPVRIILNNRWNSNDGQSVTNTGYWYLPQSFSSSPNGQSICLSQTCPYFIHLGSGLSEDIFAISALQAYCPAQGPVL